MQLDISIFEIITNQFEDGCHGSKKSVRFVPVLQSYETVIMPTAGNAFSVTRAENLFTGETSRGNVKMSGFGLSNGLSRAILSDSFLSIAVIVRPSSTESLTTGWVALRRQTKVIWEAVGT